MSRFECLSSSLSTCAVLSWLLICSISCSVAALDLENSESAVTENIGMAKPPFFAGNGSRSH